MLEITTLMDEPREMSHVNVSVTMQQGHTKARRAFLRDVISGLRSTPKRLSCKYFYDRRGSELFDQICQLDEYYLTRAELALMDQFAPEMEAQSRRRDAGGVWERQQR